MKIRRPLTDIRLNTLLLLNARPRHGYELIKDLEAFTGKRISSGQIYPLLKDLQKSGLVKIASRGRRDKKTFSMTTNGRRTVSSAISRIGGLLDSFVSSKLRKCAHCGCEVYKGGCKAVVRSKTMYFCCGNCADACRRWKA
ncbi:MAG: PadR family transcriptional regulator [Candidatus Aenigmarchaeota archaeon]|nr:PadR family transcriptional regulator [Candidatus Aenigmarchaeota archaeon]